MRQTDDGVLAAVAQIIGEHVASTWTMNCGCGETVEDCTRHIAEQIAAAGLLPGGIPPETPTPRVLDARADRRSQ